MEGSWRTASLSSLSPSSLLLRDDGSEEDCWLHQAMEMLQIDPAWRKVRQGMPIVYSTYKDKYTRKCLSPVFLRQECSCE